MKKEEFRIKFWGVRGSHPVPGSNTIKFGGNTPCVQVQIGEKLIILDAGTGICNLGHQLEKTKEEIKANILLSHTHWDHIQGIPFFTPAYKKKNTFNIYGQNYKDKSLSVLIKEQMIAPYCPIKLDDLGASFDFYEIKGGDTFKLEDDIVVKTFNNNHPNKSLAFRIEYKNHSCCYVTDNEHYPEIDKKLAQFIENADLVIYDAHYTNSEYKGENGFLKRKGWGHSTWQEGIKLAKASNASKLVLFHHAPQRSDQELEKIEKQAQAIYPNCLVAREGLVISL